MNTLVMQMDKKLLMAKAKLNKEDNESQTYGCRHTNPDICSNNSIPNIYAFTSEDCICKRPPRSWKKLFKELKAKEVKK